MGVLENPVLAKGTIAVAGALAETDTTNWLGRFCRCTTWICRWDEPFCRGGASLEYLEARFFLN